uniref:(northern house mosquito) hypothetical protein n=1 Tax=Culex pipiens TaxID=7175 RepID=A0A8D8CCB7_CULPI
MRRGRRRTPSIRRPARRGTRSARMRIKSRMHRPRKEGGSGRLAKSRPSSGGEPLRQGVVMVRAGVTGTCPATQPPTRRTTRTRWPSSGAPRPAATRPEPEAVPARRRRPPRVVANRADPVSTTFWSIWIPPLTALSAWPSSRRRSRSCAKRTTPSRPSWPASTGGGRSCEGASAKTKSRPNWRRPQLLPPERPTIEHYNKL